MIYNQVLVLRNFHRERERVLVQCDWEGRRENKNSERENERGMKGEGRTRRENKVKLSQL